MILGYSLAKSFAASGAANIGTKYSRQCDSVRNEHGTLAAIENR